MDINEEVHKLYIQCEELDKKYNGFNDKRFADIESSVERDFIVNISNFFLKERQAEVIKKGFTF
ncbi:MAG: hypothetical protein IJ608_01175 [Lachnospiraceae bacterium]|nr:hypothetical protein [Lachnospiraceae bacterium]